MQTVESKALELTKEELAVVNAMRAGAEVDVFFHGLKEYEEVIERMDLFDGLKPSRMSYLNHIDDYTKTNGNPYISFGKNYDNGKNNIKVSSTLHTTQNGEGEI